MTDTSDLKLSVGCPDIPDSILAEGASLGEKAIYGEGNVDLDKSPVPSMTDHHKFL